MSPFRALLETATEEDIELLRELLGVHIQGLVEKDVLTLEEAAAIAGRAPSTLQNAFTHWRHGREGGLKPYGLNTVRRSDLDDWLESKRG